MLVVKNENIESGEAIMLNVGSKIIIWNIKKVKIQYK